MSSRQGGIAAIALSVALALGCGACATNGDVERLETRIVSLEQHRAALKQTMEEDVQRLEKLHKMLTEAEETLRKSGANLGVRLERIEADFPKHKGTVEALQFSLKRVTKDLAIIKKELENRLGTKVFLIPPDLPKDKDGMWSAAQDAAKANNVPQAQAIYEIYEANFPDDVRAPFAFWEIAKLHEAAGSQEEAIAFYQKIDATYKDAPIAPQAVMRIAELYALQGNCQQAKGIYEFITSNYRGSAEADVAKARARAITRKAIRNSECKPPTPG